MKLIEFISKRPLVILLSISVITFFALGKTLEFYFYTDDYAVLYHFINNIPYIYPFYVFVPKIYGPIYNLFGLNPFPYFSLALFTHIFASLSIYLFARKVTKNNLIALLSCLIFATGYIGVDSFSQMNTSTVDSLNVILTMLSVFFFYSFLENGKFRFYTLALIIFYLGVTIFPFRAFPMILFLLTSDIILSLKLKRFRPSMVKIILRALPFVLIYYTSGVGSYGQGILGNFIKAFSLDYFGLFFGVIGNMVVPRSIIATNSAAVGIIFIISVAMIVFYSRIKFAHLSKILLLTTLFTIEGFIGFFILLPIFSTNNAELNRYFSLSFAAYSILISLATFLFFNMFVKEKKALWTIPLLLILIIFSLLSFNYQSFIVKERSMHANRFFEQLRKYVPEIYSEERSIFYFDRANYGSVPQNFGPIILGAYMAPEATLAVHYKVPVGKIKIAKDFNELRSIVDKKGNLNNIYTFYYDENGLIQTTDKVKESLVLQQSYGGEANKFFRVEPVIEINENGSTFSNSEILTPLESIPSHAPATLSFDIKITPVLNFEFPLSDSTEKAMIINNKSLYFDYILSRKKYYQDTKVEVSSSHPLQSKDFLLDNKIKTHWFTEEGPWQVGQIPWVRIDLGETKEINRIAWVNVSSVRTPRDYEILTSLDGKDWKSVKRITNISQKGNEELVFDSFSKTMARFVLIKIYKTTENWAPGFSEIEIIEDKYREVNVEFSRRLEGRPFEYVKDQNDLGLTLNYLTNNAEIGILVRTNKDKVFNLDESLKLLIIPDGQFHSYSLELPPGGLYFEEIKILPLNFPAALELRNISISL